MGYAAYQAGDVEPGAVPTLPTLPRRDAAFTQPPAAGSLHRAGCKDEWRSVTGPATFFFALHSPVGYLGHQKKKAHEISLVGPFVTRQRPTFPLPHSSSIIGLGGLNFRVRDGNGCGPSGKATGNILNSSEPSAFSSQLPDLELMAVS